MQTPLVPYTVYGRLTALADAPFAKPGRRHILCLCACGKTTIVRADLLFGGKTRSCGCLRSEAARSRALALWAGRKTPSA
jgi:hypothetical protein